MSKLAIHGGKPVCSPAIDTDSFQPMRYGPEESVALDKVIKSGNLCSVMGSEVRQFENTAADYFGCTDAYATSSCTTAIHTALAAVGVGWGDEVITSPVTDMGTILGIIAQGARPVFVDVDEETCNMLPENLEQAITGRTSAILAVHLLGIPCDIDAITGIAKKHNIPVVEDCAQGWLAEYRGRQVGTIGSIGCFSLNDFKHISSGEGGLCITDDPDLAKRMRLFIDKAYDRQGTRRNPSFFGMNYRMSELQAAVAGVQLSKCSDIVARRREIANKINSALSGTPGLICYQDRSDCRGSYYCMLFRADKAAIDTPASELIKALAAEGLPVWTQFYGGVPVYLYDCFTQPEKHFFRLPPLAGIGKDFPGDFYYKGLCPVAERVQGEMIMISSNEFYSDEQVDRIIEGMEKVFNHYSGASRDL